MLAKISDKPRLHCTTYLDPNLLSWIKSGFGKSEHLSGWISDLRWLVDPDYSNPDRCSHLPDSISWSKWIQI